ncbi:MAG TPA: hypothetical protein VMT86_05160 [Bryobacteraceae bacterium]|nr:hypothetical protein [Bryobacteraceae bacterium]
MKQTIVALLCALCAANTLPLFAQNTPANTIATTGYLYPTPVNVAPGQVVTLFVPDLDLSGNISVTVRQINEYTAPILSTNTGIVNCPAAPQVACVVYGAITVQIPYEVWQICVSNVCPDVTAATSLFITQNGTAGPAIVLNPAADHVHLLTSCDTAVGGSGNPPGYGLPCPPLITHADGSLVAASNPAQANEELVAYATGLGLTNPVATTGKPATSAVPTQETFQLGFNFVPNALAAQPIPLPPGALPTRYATPIFSGLSAGYVGLYQINFLVPPPPAGLMACGGAVQSNLSVSVGGQYSFDGAGICVP